MQDALEAASSALTLLCSAAAVTLSLSAADPYEERDYRKGDARLRQNPLLVKIQTGKVRQ
jgi:hypothetical protein